MKKELMKEPYLKASKRVDLLDIAKELNIKGRHAQKKQELIANILQAYSLQEPMIQEVTEVTEEDNKVVEKREYIANAPLGTPVAFSTPNGTYTGFIVNRSRQQGKLMIQESNKDGTKTNVCHTVKFDDVLWVKYGARYPRNIYAMILETHRKKEREQGGADAQQI